MVIAENADLLEAVSGQLVNLAKVSEAVWLVYGEGACPANLQPFTHSILLDSSSSGGRQPLIALRAGRRRATPEHQLLTLARRNKRLAAVMGTVDCITGVGEDAEQVAKQLAQKTTAQFIPPDQVVHEVTTGRLAHLDNPSSDIRHRLANKPRLGSFTRRVAALPRPLSADLFPGVLALLRVLLPTNSFEAIGQAAEVLAEIPSSALSACDAVRRDATLALASLTATAVIPQDHGDIVQKVLETADRGLEQGDIELTAEFTHLATQLLFHREINADGHSSPLVDDPREFLRVWHTSDVAQLLTGSVAPGQETAQPTSAEPSPTAEPMGTQVRVLVLPGSYPNFCYPLVESLSTDADVRVLELHDQPRFKGNGPQHAVLEARLKHALGRPFDGHPQMAAEMDACDVVFVDWADRGALMATMTLPEGLPLVLRIHSMDALSPWIHLIDWSRVDDLVLVSEHLRVVVQQLLGHRLDHTRVHVIPNIIRPPRSIRPSAEGFRRRLLMIGWGQRVKDPIWALEVLGRLRESDEGWELIMLGRPFDARQSVSTRDYSLRFQDRLTWDDVRGAVELVDFTPDIDPYLDRCGFALSASRRESFGVGIVEAAASGLVPVVRNWPMFAALSGARGLFPHDWVVDSVPAAADRVLSLSQAEHWSAASGAARTAVDKRFNYAEACAAYHRVVLGAVHR